MPKSRLQNTALRGIYRLLPFAVAIALLTQAAPLLAREPVARPVPDQRASELQKPDRQRRLFSLDGDPQRADRPFLDRAFVESNETVAAPVTLDSLRTLTPLADLNDARLLRRSTTTAVANDRLPALGNARQPREKDLPWSPDQLLANPTNMNDEHVVIVENPLSGDLFCVFAATDLGGTDRDIHISRSQDDGLTWTTWEMPASSLDEYHPDLAVDAGGYLHAVWIRDDGTLMRARSLSPNDPAQWANVAEFVVGEPLAIPSLAVSGAGAFSRIFIAVDWQTANYDYLWYEWTLLFLYSTNGGLSMNYDYFLPDGYEDLWPSVAMDGTTVHFLNAEVDLDTGETEILIATDALTGGFADPGLLTGWTSSNCGFPDIVCQDQDVFLVYQHDYSDGLTTDGDIIYNYSWDAGATFFGPIGMMADEYESVGPSVFTRDGIVGVAWLDAPPGGDEFRLAARLGSGRGHTDLMGDVEMVSETATVEPMFRSCGAAVTPGGIQAAWIDRRDYPTEGHNVYTSRRALTANLAPYAPEGWDNALVAATAPGGRTDGYLAAGDMTWVSFAFLNDGLADAAGPFAVQLRLDGAQVAAWSAASLATGSYITVEDHPVVVAVGSHELTVVLDAGATIAESNELDNTITRAFDWIEGDPALRLNPGYLTKTIIRPLGKSAARDLASDPITRREVHLPVIDTPLARSMDRATDADLLRVMIVPAERLDPQAMNTALSGAGRAQRRSVTLTAARTQSDRFWSALRPELDRLETQGRLRQARPLWISGAIAARLSPSAIEELATNPAVGRLWLDDAPSITLAEPAAVAAKALEKANAWHIAAIKADALWAEGITGEGVLVGHLDTGIAYDHPDLANRMWDGGAAWPHHGYDAVDDDDDPYDGDTSFHHGTHTAGLIAGDGTQGTATGAAPGATLMALRAIPGYLADLDEAIQFGLDHGVDLFSLSGGWAQSSEALRVANRYTAEMLLAVDVPWICSAGNGDNYGGHYPAPTDIVSPADSPSAFTAPNGGNTAVFAVGAVTQALGYWSDSSYGPTEWSAENTLGTTDYSDYPYAPGLIKPDIAAPGDMIVSCSGSSGYVTYSGTSMACPLVTGSFCLLWSAAPSLNVQQLCEAIETSATDITASPASAGRDNYTGAGLVNLTAALNRLPTAQAESFWICNDGVLPLRIEAIYPTGPWLSIPAPAGAIDPGDSVRVSALIDPEGLLDGIYHADAIIVSNDPATMRRLPVTLYLGESLSPIGDEPPAPVAGKLTNRPNPFNPRTILRFSTDRTGPVLLEIYDLRGRRVRRLLDESLPAGSHESVWDGADDAGRSSASGQYVARLVAGQAEPVNRKLTLLR